MIPGDDVEFVVRLTKFGNNHQRRTAFATKRDFRPIASFELDVLASSKPLAALVYVQPDMGWASGEVLTPDCFGALQRLSVESDASICSSR